GRPGPVVLALPEDMLSATVEAADAPRYQRVQAAPAPGDVERIVALLDGAERPFAILGGSGWDATSLADIRAFVEAWRLPVGCAFRFQDLFDNAHPQYAGDVGIGINPKLSSRIREADVVLAIGPRLGEMTTSGYTLFTPPVPKQKLVHVHAGASELGRVYQGELLVNASMPRFASAMAATRPSRSVPWSARTRQANADYHANRVAQPMPGTLDMAQVERARH